MVGLLEAHAIVPVDNTLMTGADISNTLSLSSRIS